MADRYLKTDTGRDEIRARIHAISRTARNLLLIIDASRSGREWLSMVRGASETDLQTLLDAGLIVSANAAPSAPAPTPAASPTMAPTTAPSAAPSTAATATPSSATPPSAPAAPSLQASSLSYSELYDLLPSLAKEHLGLLKGYRFALAIERADGLLGLQQVAHELVLEVERAKGAAVARAVKRALLI